MALFGAAARRYLAYIFLLLLLGGTSYLPFILGMMLSDFFFSAWAEKWRAVFRDRYTILIPCIFVAIPLALYFPDQRNIMCQWMDFPLVWIKDAKLLTSLYVNSGAALVLFIIGNSLCLHKVLNHPVFLFLGRISFALYLVHVPIIFSLSCYLFLVGIESGLTYALSFFAAFAGSLPVIFLTAYFVYRYVDRPTAKIAKTFDKWVNGK